MPLVVEAALRLNVCDGKEPVVGQFREGLARELQVLSAGLAI